MLSPDIGERSHRITLFASSAAIGVAVAGGLYAIETEANLNTVLAIAAVLGIAALALYGRDVAMLYRRRKRRQLELNMKMAGCGFASLAAAVSLGFALVATGLFDVHVGAFVFLVAFGWLSGLILAKLYKIVAFLTWLEAYGPAMGRVTTPRVQDLVAERRAARWFAAYFVSVWSATVALLLAQPLAFRIAALAMTAATVGIAAELIRTRRLTEVAEPSRLPAGTRMPLLLYART
jgi:hypothetical protein